MKGDAKTILNLMIGLCFMIGNVHAQSDRVSVRTHLGYGPTNWINTNHTHAIFSYNAGVELRSAIGAKGIYLQSGIRWNEYGFGDEDEWLVWDGEQYVLTTYTYRRTDFYASIPVILSYKLNKGLPGLTVSAGIQCSFYAFTKSGFDGELYFSSNKSVPISAAAHAALGYEWALNKSWLIGAEVYYNFNFPVTSNFGSDESYNLGLALSGRYILK